jgi:hypothetical protein
MINSIVPLTTQRWENARAQAERTIRERLQEPTRRQFRAGDSEYPPALIVAVIVLMIVVAVAAFYLSALKEVTVTDITLTTLVNNFQKLTDRNVVIGTLAVLALSEAGSLLFGFASRVISKQARVRMLLRAFQALCVLVAVIANVSITMAHPAPAVAVFDWLITVGAPLLVIGIGLILEELSADWLAANVVSVLAFNSAVKQYQTESAQPDRHSDFYAVWGQAILDQLIQQSKHNREIIPALIEVDPRVRQMIVYRQFERFNWTFDKDTKPEALPAGVSVLPMFPDTEVPIKKHSAEIQAVLDWWDATPDQHHLAQRAIADKCRVSLATVNRALKLVGTTETPETSANGHHKEEKI